MRSQMQGVTLIELMIAVVIVGILAAIAYPSYTSYVERARRTDAQTVLLEGAQFMERIYTERGAYNKQANVNATTTADTLTELGFPASLTQSPRGSSTPHYNIALQGALQEDSFTLRATPVVTGSKCGSLLLSADGTRSITDKPAGSTATASECWGR